MTPLEIEIAAATRKHERLALIEEALADVPQRKSKGSELQLLVTAIMTAHDLLCQYDLMPLPPGVSGSIETGMLATIKRACEVIAARTK